MEPAQDSGSDYEGTSVRFRGHAQPMPSEVEETSRLCAWFVIDFFVCPDCEPTSLARFLAAVPLVKETPSFIYVAALLLLYWLSLIFPRAHIAEPELLLVVAVLVARKIFLDSTSSEATATANANG
ncbi:hypothetical protein AURDEDRAFT_177217 [Auricularia subglabra TFB-10046 SS5]|uniref:Uncharacterized protein n=1 Tax=Auricularia subglabra (strain TFB-10046 / SS5) TaxID=717982 RepID=J0CTP4_AURST|nr:hypothetical protein AURDEDRAFT_177217 [Auricularia subglabra TFB-10046 SS5]